MVGCFPSGKDYKALFNGAQSENRSLKQGHEDLTRQKDTAYAGLHEARDEAAKARADAEAQQDRANKLVSYLEDQVAQKNKALVECIKTLRSEDGTKGTLPNGVSEESPETCTASVIREFETRNTGAGDRVRDAVQKMQATMEENERLVREEAAAQERRANAESKAKQLSEAAELRSKALENNNNGLTDLNKELQERLLRLEKKWRDAKESGHLGDSKNARLQQDLDEAHEQADRAVKERGQLYDELSEASQSLESHKRQLAATQQELQVTQVEAKSHLERATALQESSDAFKSRAITAEADLKSTREELSQNQEKVASLTTKSIAQGTDIETLSKRLADHKQRNEHVQSQLAQAKADLRHAEERLEDLNEKYTTTKRELVSNNERLASVLNMYQKLLDEAGTEGDTLVITNKELKECRKHLAEAQSGIDHLKAKRDELKAKLEQSNTELQILSAHASSADRDIACKNSLLGALVRLAKRCAELGSAGMGSEDGLESFYQVAMSEAHMQVKLCDLSLGLVTPLASGVMDTKSLGHLVVDIDASREAVPEKAGLRVACLASALSLNNSLNEVELLGNSWEENGTGMAAPFLAIGCPPPSTTLDPPTSTLEMIQIDTRLFAPGCARILSDLLLKGLVELKRPSGKGTLRLYTEHGDLDEWYGEFIEDSVSLNQPTHGHPPTVEAVRRHTMASSGANGSSIDSLANGDRMGRPSEVSVHLPTPPMLASEHPPKSSDLKQQGLESHHMVMVMAVLLTCPHLERLHLDGNKIGDTGFETLAIGLAHNTLRELNVSRNMMKQAGARAMGQALKENRGLKQLDISGQRFEGLGAAGTEEFAGAIRVNKTLLELGIANNNLGTSGASKLASVLPHNTSLLRLNVVTANAMDEGAMRGALQRAARRPNLVIA